MQKQKLTMTALIANMMIYSAPWAELGDVVLSRNNTNTGSGMRSRSQQKRRIHERQKLSRSGRR